LRRVRSVPQKEKKAEVGSFGKKVGPKVSGGLLINYRNQSKRWLRRTLVGDLVQSGKVPSYEFSTTQPIGRKSVGEREGNTGVNLKRSFDKELGGEK